MSRNHFVGFILVRMKKVYLYIQILDLRDYYLFDNEDVDFPEDLEINTDDNPVVEFRISKALYTKR